jgi:hypothetical protein
LIERTEIVEERSVTDFWTAVRKTDRSKIWCRNRERERESKIVIETGERYVRQDSDQ